MYRILDREFHNKEYGNEPYLNNWPMLYILENGEQAYVGQSTNVVNRMQQHKVNEEKEKFKNVHLIYSNEFNQSVTFDYESKLIQLIAADEQYILTNGNAGIADKNYYKKEYYDTNFKELWERLRN
jgi:GIY-YIG catalytic domain.